MWINMNFLAVSALRYYAEQPGPHAQAAGGLADELAESVSAGVVSEYYRSGFLWENYDSDTGAGRGTAPFTGWTALVSMFVAGRYPF